MRRLRTFMFDRVYLGEQARAEHAKIARMIRTLFHHYCEHPAELPPSTAGDPLSVRVTDYLAGMTDRFASGPSRPWRCRRASCRPPCLRAGTPTTPRSGCARRPTWPSSWARAPTCAAPGPGATSGLCPFHDERTPSFSVDADKMVYHCFGCRESGDVFTFVRETEGLEFTAALELLADRYGVALERSAEDPAAAARREKRERLYALLERTAAYYERVLWESAEAAGAREYLAERGLGEEVLRRFRVGLGAERRGTASIGLAAGGLPRRGAVRRRAWPRARAATASSTTASARASSSRWPTSAGGSSGSARARCPAGPRGRST